MKMFPRKPAKPEQLELFRPKVDRPQWQSLSPKVKRQVTAILAQLIADFVAADIRYNRGRSCFDASLHRSTNRRFVESQWFTNWSRQSLYERANHVAP